MLFKPIEEKHNQAVDLAVLAQYNNVIRITCSSRNNILWPLTRFISRTVLRQSSGVTPKPWISGDPPSPYSYGPVPQWDPVDHAISVHR